MHLKKAWLYLDLAGRAKPDFQWGSHCCCFLLLFFSYFTFHLLKNCCFLFFVWVFSFLVRRGSFTSPPCKKKKKTCFSFINTWKFLFSLTSFFFPWKTLRKRIISFEMAASGENPVLVICPSLLQGQYSTLERWHQLCPRKTVPIP